MSRSDDLYRIMRELEEIGDNDSIISASLSNIAITLAMIEEKMEQRTAGEWLDHQNGIWIYAKCSKCESVHDVKSKYCPTCGAKMKMEGDDDLS